MTTWARGCSRRSPPCRGYYPTRAEAEILKTHADEIVAALGGPVWLLELGSGDGQKTRLMIEALLARQGTLEYVPVDISESAVVGSSRSLLFSYPALRITAYVGEYHRALRKIREERVAPGRTLVLFLGSTLGNLDPEEQHRPPARRAGALESRRGLPPRARPQEVREPADPRLRRRAWG